MSMHPKGSDGSSNQRNASRQSTAQPAADEQIQAGAEQAILGLSTGQQAMLRMQRTQGNAAVQRMLRQNVSAVVQRDPPDAAAQVEGAIRGTVLTIQQPSGMACWATVATMMASQHDGTAYTVADIPRVIGRAGSRFVTIFTNDTGLGSADKGPFLTAMGLIAEPPQSLSPQGIAGMLNGVGPIWITTDGGSLNTIHARIILRISGDGTADGTSLEIIDPADGAIHLETYAVFGSRFENVARRDAGRHPGGANPFRAQIVHW